MPKHPRSSSAPSLGPRPDLRGRSSQEDNSSASELDDSRHVSLPHTYSAARGKTRFVVPMPGALRDIDPVLVLPSSCTQVEQAPREVCECGGQPV